MKSNVYNYICESFDILYEAIEFIYSDNKSADLSLADVISYTHSVIGYLNHNASEESDLIDTFDKLYKTLYEDNHELSLNVILQVRSAILECEVVKLTAEELKAVTQFDKYLDVLYQAKCDGYCIAVTSADTPCGSVNFTAQFDDKLKQLGIQSALYNEYRASFCAFIDGNDIEEKLSHDDVTSITRTVGNTVFFIDSAGMSQRNTIRHFNILVNDTQYVIGRRGLSFLVYDKESQIVLDSVNFDTYDDAIPCSRGGADTRVTELTNRYPGVVFINLGLGGFPQNNLTENEQYLLDNQIYFGNLLQYKNYESPLYKYISKDDISEVLSVPDAYIGTDGARHMNDYAGKHINIVNGHRVTTEQPSSYKRTIYTVGGCGILGVGVRDEGTIASKLQKLLNEKAPDEEFVVENYGMALHLLDANKEMIAIIDALEPRPGDIVVGIGNDIVGYNRSKDKDPYRYGELFFDYFAHMTEDAWSVVAEGVFDTLQNNDFYRDRLSVTNKVSESRSANYDLSAEQNVELEEYKAMLNNLYKSELLESDNIGCIVMNCNPFTNGHKYLVEKALEQCEHLVIFVVQEDKSFFKFEDRIELVRRGVCEFKNVHVIHSGRFIISSLTFKDYFNKSSMQDRVVDTSDDVMLFVNEIAPAAGIKKRFAGTEPLDKVTCQYNRTMERILPNHGVEFIEIDRKTTGDSVISASRVRKLMEEKRLDEIKQLVPETTYSFLIQKYT